MGNRRAPSPPPGPRSAAGAPPAFWRRPAFALLCGTLIVFISLGIRNSFGVFLRPVSADLGWGREALSLALATQALLVGAAAPLAGMLADRWGAPRVIMIGGLLFSSGVFLMARSTTPEGMLASGGALAGLGLGACGFPLVLAVVGQIAPEARRSLWLGIVAAGGVGGQLFLIPLSQFLVSAYDWFVGLTTLALIAGVIVPLAFSASRAHDSRVSGTAGGDAAIGLAAALREAAGHRGFLLLTVGFYVCGFQVQFLSAHLPAYLVDRGFGAYFGASMLVVIALANMLGGVSFGYLGGRLSKKNLLSAIYMARAVAICAFVSLPVTHASVVAFAATIGFLWLCTIPLTVGIVGQVFGMRHVAVLYGVTFFSHQLGSFTGVWLGGRLFDATGSYDAIWWLLVGLGVVASVLHVPIDERPVPRLAGAGAG